MAPDEPGHYRLNKREDYEVFVVFIKKIKPGGTGEFLSPKQVKGR